MVGKIASLLALAGFVLAQKPQYPPGFPPTPILSSAINYAPSVLPNIKDKSAPNAQKKCPGYTLVQGSLQETNAGMTADLKLAGKACNVYGNDIRDLTLEVNYQSQDRLNVRVYPKYIAPWNETMYMLSGDLTPQGQSQANASKSTSDLRFEYSDSPSFQFKVVRADSGETLFSTYNTVIVFEDQFLELKTSMVEDYNIYGLAEVQRGFRIPNNYDQTFWNAYNLDYDLALDVNAHGVHPMYVETRYKNGGSSSHGVYARNAHGQDWLMRENSLTYRAIGGSHDLYFFAGKTAKKVISQYQTGVIGTPYLPAYWHLGSGQNRWSYQNVSNLQAVVDAYAASEIQLEMVFNDLDIYDVNRMFTLNPGHYDQAEMAAFLDQLHANGQYYVPILDPHIYVPNPNNASDSYPPYDRGVELQTYIRDGNSSWYVGVEWPGFVVWPDFLVPSGQQFWTEQIQKYFQILDFDGFWLDVSDAVSYATGSQSDKIGLNPIHVPFALPGDPDTANAVDYRYPEQFARTNASEAASASRSLASQSKAYPTPATTPTPTAKRTYAQAGMRNLTFPPYAINANALPGNSLVKQTISPDATHNDEYNTTEYALHNLYGHMSGNATYQALKTLRAGERPYYLSRSTFAGSGAFAGHWSQDGISEWWNMYFGISMALQHNIAGIPYWGLEICGFRANADLELCTRWMQLGSWFSLYRNHNSRNTIAQEPYRWATTAEATRRANHIRYTLLPYTYTLYYQAHTQGETVLRALAWEFPNDESLKAVDNQFMSGPSIMVIPVLEVGATAVKGVFPGVADGQIWYDYHTLAKVDVSAGENKTIQAPLTFQPVYVRGGRIIPTQTAGNVTRTSKMNPWNLVVALDKNGQAEGELYIDDGITLDTTDFKTVDLKYANKTLTATVSGSYNDNLAMSNVTIAGLKQKPQSISVSQGGNSRDTSTAKFEWYDDNVLCIWQLGNSTQNVWSDNLQIQIN